VSATAAICATPRAIWSRAAPASGPAFGVVEAERQHAEQRLVAVHGDEERVRMVARAGEARQGQLGRVAPHDAVADELVAEHFVDVFGERGAVQVRRHPRGRRRRDDPKRERFASRGARAPPRRAP
jgi:hypothetical protein